jgi:hypothetical protein
MRRICETAAIEPETLYGKIDFIHRQCEVFSAKFERLLVDGLSLERLYLSVDRQEYVLNWGSQLDRRNVKLTAIGTAEHRTGYVFGMHLNFDPKPDPEEIEREAVDNGDYELPPAFRRHARYWLQRDRQTIEYLENRVSAHQKADTLGGALGQEYLSRLADAKRAIGARDADAIATLEDEPNEVGTTWRRPPIGMQVRVEYVMLAHFFYLKRLLTGVGKIRFFLDQEPGIAGACFAAFRDEVRERRLEAFHVSINKDFTVDEKKLAKAGGELKLAALQRKEPTLERSAAVTRILAETIEQERRKAGHELFWVRHPFPDMGEPEKAVRHLTFFGDMDSEHVARLYNMATLRTIDRFFMLVRRRLSLFERPIASSANQMRRWHGYSAYNPAVAQKVLSIFRVFYNFALAGEDGHTPAMRLGLIDRVVTLDELLNYMDKTATARRSEIVSQPSDRARPKGSSRQGKGRDATSE